MIAAEALTPSRIVAELDRHIVGQQAAKRAVAIALRNRWRRLQADADMRPEIMPNNILMIGATGVGKTEIARRLAALAQAPFVKVEASKFTEVGYVGRDVESMVRDLVEQAVAQAKERHRETVKAKAAELAQQQLLDILIPPVAERAGGYGIGFDRASLADDPHDLRRADGETAALNQRTREKFKAMLERGELDQRTVEIETSLPAPQVQVMGNPAMEGMPGLQDMLAGMLPKRTRKQTVTVAEAREQLTREQAEKLLDMDAVAQEAIQLAQTQGIIFIDEIDKVAGKRGQAGGPDVSREGVQRDLLPIVEGSVVATEYGPVKTDHVLFIAAGAFHVAKPSDLIPELQGRFPIRVELSALSESDFVKILQEPRSALTKQYAALLAAEGLALSFEPGSIEAIAEIAFQVNEQVENIGARRLHTVLSHLLEGILFDAPDQQPSGDVKITPDFVRQRLGPLAASRDLSQYIL